MKKKRLPRRIFILTLAVGLLSQGYPVNVLYNNGGLFFVGDRSDAPSTAVTLYVGGDMTFEGNTVSVVQRGTTLLTGDFVNNVTDGNVFSADSSGTVLFAGTEAQTIYGSANKATNYINFPNMTVSNMASVRIDANMGVEVSNLTLARGRLVLQSQLRDTMPSSPTELAHLLVRTGGSVSYNRDTLARDSSGIIQVELALGDNHLRNRVVGFSPPFRRIYSDYFTFNYLSKPSPEGLFGDNKRLITDLDVAMNAGEGYIVGQGLPEDSIDYDNIDQRWPDIRFEDRYTEMFSFARGYMPVSFSQYNVAADRFSGEEINIGDVTVELNEPGIHYLGNPFTTPLDLDGFTNDTLAVDEWGVTRDSIEINSQAEFASAFYVMSGGEISYNESTNKYRFNVSYLLGQAVGSTVNIEGTGPNIIAPMQMFIVNKHQETSSKFIIPASARSHGHAPFLRAFSAGKSCTDELLIEVTDEDTGAFDRMCVVFRKGAGLGSGDAYDAAKLFNYSKGVSQIYTRSSDNKDMTTQVISPQTESMPICLAPTSSERNVSLSAYRINSISSVDFAILEDRFTGQRTDLLLTPSYRFTTRPDDPEERFVLHFRDTEPTGQENPTARSVIVYSDNKQIKIRGLSENDNGCCVIVADMQGRIIHNEIVTGAWDGSLNCRFETGTYIVKITGTHRNTANKVPVK